MLTPCDLFSWVKTAKRIRSIDVLSWKVPMGRVRRLNFSEPSLDGVRGSHGPTLVGGFVAEAGEQLVEVVAQTGDG